MFDIQQDDLERYASYAGGGVAGGMAFVGLNHFLSDFNIKKDEDGEPETDEEGEIKRTVPQDAITGGLTALGILSGAYGVATSNDLFVGAGVTATSLGAYKLVNKHLLPLIPEDSRDSASKFVPQTQGLGAYEEITAYQGDDFDMMPRQNALVGYGDYTETQEMSLL